MTAIELEVGDAIAERDFHLDRAALLAYADASGDQNPIHQDDAVALAVGLPGVIAHGMLTMGAAVQPVVDWLAESMPGMRIADYGVRFTRPVVVDAGPGTQVEVEAKVGALELTEAHTMRVDLTVTVGDQTVLGKAQVRLVARRPAPRDGTVVLE